MTSDEALLPPAVHRLAVLERATDHSPESLPPVDLAPSDPPDAFAEDAVLAGAARHLPAGIVEGLQAFGQYCAAPQALELARLVRLFEPRQDAGARFADLHPAWHALMRRSVAEGLAGSVWSAKPDEAGHRHLIRALRLATTAGTESLHLQALSRSHAGIAALMNDEALLAQHATKLTGTDYDPRAAAPAEKQSLVLGLATSEPVQAAGDELTTPLAGVPCSANAPDLILALSEGEGGSSCYLISTHEAAGLRMTQQADGPRLHLRDVPATRLGRAGNAADVLAELSTLQRLDDALLRVGAMKRAVADALQGAARNESAKVALADAALDIAGVEALALRLAASFDLAAQDPIEAGYARLLAPALDHWSSRILPAVLSECGRTASPVATSNASEDIAEILRRGPRTVDRVTARIAEAMPSDTEGTTGVLQAARRTVTDSPGTIRLFIEQLAYAAAAAALTSIAPAPVATAFIETRLGHPWRSGYGMLDARHDADALIGALGLRPVHNAPAR